MRDYPEIQNTIKSSNQSWKLHPTYCNVAAIVYLDKLDLVCIFPFPMIKASGILPYSKQ